MPGPAVDYKIPSFNPGSYRPDARSLFDQGHPSPGRAFPQTIQNVRATNPSEKGSATIIPACASFMVNPASSPTAAQGRSIQTGIFPVVAYILDDSGAEIAPPLIVTGPQTFKFGSLCRGIRLEQSALANGTDSAWDVTIDPDPNGEWLPANPQPPNGASLLARWTGYVSGGVGVVNWISGTIPVGTRHLLWLGQNTVYGSASALVIGMEIPWGVGRTIHPSKNLISAAAASLPKGFCVWGPEENSALATLATDAIVGDSPAAQQSAVTIDLIPGPCRFGVYNSSAGNTWDVDVYAIVAA